MLKPLSSHDVGVGDGVGDGYVSVHADDHQVEDAGGAGPDVHTEPYEAEIPDKIVRLGGGGVLWSHLPKIQLSTTSYTAERGRTRTPSNKSATARETMKV